MPRSSALRGSRIGSGPLGETERGELAERVAVAFWCASGHMTRLQFSVTAAAPDVWECHRCGQPAGRDQDDPPAALTVQPYKTHLAYLRERRSDEDAEILLAEALARLRAA